MTSLAVRCEEVTKTFRKNGSSGHLPLRRAYVKGSVWTELLLWLFFLLPGLFYSIWRLSTRYQGCPSCGMEGMIPANSPRAVELLRQKEGGKNT